MDRILNDKKNALWQERYSSLTEQLDREIEKYHEEMIALSDDLADHPEISRQEYRSSAEIVKILRKYGFQVEYPFAGYDTAFRGHFGTSGRKFRAAILAEYDALPEIGHACGHCVSGAISVLAALASRDLQDALDCDIDIIGTPVEEDDGSKVVMAANGVFDDYDMAMMIHLFDENFVHTVLMALATTVYNFYGKAAHSAQAPWDGVNALNAAQLFMHGVDSLRQHVTPDVRMHAVYRDGGARPGVVPEKATVEIYSRALKRPYLDWLNDRITDIAKGACLMTGAEMEHHMTADPYSDLKRDEEGIATLTEIFDELGIELTPDPGRIFGSSDMGNVSYVCPAFHPALKIAPVGTAIHTREFEEAVRTDEAHEAIALGAKVIGRQIIRRLMDGRPDKK